MPANTNFFQRSTAVSLPFFRIVIDQKGSGDVWLRGKQRRGDHKGKQCCERAVIAQEREMLQQKLDEIIAFECMFCGEVMIKSIHTSFITPEDEANEGSEWAI
uniref:Uncharacterized protein n=1 Tax=Peronospora matthiolae TaxID=2874970 RepID=A0AAV1SZ85_9STRA